MKHLTGLQQYAVITANYWAFTLTDGALRMLVVFHFHQLGYSSLEIAFLFLFYEFFGIITNLAGGWLAARLGLRFTLRAGTLLQILALLMLVPVSASWPKLLSVGYVVNAIAAYFLFGEAVTLTRWLGIGFIVIGVWLVARS